MLFKLKTIIYLYRFYIFILLLSLLPLFYIFNTSQLLHTHDGLVHLARLGAFFKALQDGQIPVRWAGDLNYGYGMPLFNYIYHLPYAVSSVFLFLGFSLVNSFKISLALSYIASGIFMYAFANIFFKDNKKALLVAVFYQFAPFRLVELLIRGSFGEVYTYTFLPLILYGLTGLFVSQQKTKRADGNITSRRDKSIYFYLSVIGSSLLVLSHNALSLIFFGIAFLYIIFFSPNIRKFLIATASLIIGLFISSYYWVSAIFEHKFTYGDLFMKDMYLSHFPPLKNLFIPNLNNSQSLQTGGVSVQIGLFHTIAITVCLALFFFLKKKNGDKLKRTILYSVLLFCIALFFMTPYSKVIWSNIPLLRQFQFPWRLLGVIVFSTSLAAAGLLNIPFIKKKIIYSLLLLLVVFSTYSYWYPVLGYDKINEKNYWNFPLNTTYFGETDLIWSGGPASSYPKKRVDVIGGDARILEFRKKSNLHVYTIDAKTDAQIVDHTQYFPGWKVFIDGRQTDIEFQDENWRGQITFYVPKGFHTIKVVFGESIVRFLADTLSLISLLFLFIFWFFRKRIVI